MKNSKNDEFTKVIESANEVEALPPSLPTYEMDHLRNALIPIFINKQVDISKELETSQIVFDVGIFKVRITRN